MSEPKTLKEIDKRLKDLARECGAAEGERRGELESEISALCLQRWLLQGIRELCESEKKPDS